MIGFEHPDDHASTTKDAEIAADFGKLLVESSQRHFSDEHLGGKYARFGSGGDGGGSEEGGGGGGREKEGGGDRRIVDHLREPNVGVSDEETKKRFEDSNFEESLGYLP